MRLVLNDKLLKNLNYNGITTASKIFNDVSEDSDKKEIISIAEEINIENSYALRKDREGVLISSDVSVKSTEPDLDIDIQSLACKINFVLDFEFENEDEKTEWINLEANDMIAKIQPRVEPIIQYEVIEIINYINNKSGLNKNKTKPIFIDI